MKKLTFLLTLILLSAATTFTFADNGKASTTRQERKLIMSGNALYSKQKYADALKQYELALKVNPQSAVAIYNAGLSRLRLAAAPGVKEEDRKEYEKTGMQAMENVAKLGSVKPELASRASYNLGNLAFNSQDFQSAVGHYKQALRLNSNDNNARRNLRIAQKKLQNQNKNQDKNKQNQQQKQDKKQDKKEQNKDKQNQNQDKQDQQKQPPQTPENQISQQTADQILKAMENKEAQTRARVMNPQKQNQNRRQSRHPW